MSRIQRILIVKLSSFGDVIHALPTLEGLRTAFPAAHITWLVEAAFAPLLMGHPALDEVWPVPRVRPGRKVEKDELLQLLRLARRMRVAAFDLVIDLQGLLKSAMWVALAKGKRKLGYDRTRELSYLALTERLAPYDPETHAVWRYLNVARHLGAPPAPPRFRLGLTPVLPPALLPLDRPLAVLHPGARWATKLWPAASWAHLADWLIREKKLAAVITGSAGDRDLADQICAQMQEKPLNLAGRTGLRELAGIMQQARLAVTADTGPMHLAAALGTRVVAVFGPTSPARTGPFGQGHRVVRLGLQCSPCFRRRCPEPRCLLDLPWHALRTACEKILSIDVKN
ncbi:MAG: lipopolysaccharide heptosyltransferase II [Deltaproteobacteria bacterium]|nr:MAG: lipopolysaccharide heptosyltransferase II [Deltaproteobacteria bacterium]